MIISAWFTAPGVLSPGTNFLKLSSFDEPWCVSISVIFLNSFSCAVLFSDAVEIEDTKLVLTSLVVSRLLTRRFEFPVIIRATSLRISFLWSSLFWLTLVMVYSLYSLMKLQMVSNPTLFDPAKVGSGGGISLGVGGSLAGGAGFWRYFFRFSLFFSISSFCVPWVLSLMKFSMMAAAAMAAFACFSRPRERSMISWFYSVMRGLDPHITLVILSIVFCFLQ